MSTSHFLQIRLQELKIIFTTTLSKTKDTEDAQITSILTNQTKSISITQAYQARKDKKAFCCWMLGYHIKNLVLNCKTQHHHAKDKCFKWLWIPGFPKDRGFHLKKHFKLVLFLKERISNTSRNHIIFQNMIQKINVILYGLNSFLWPLSDNYSMTRWRPKIALQSDHQPAKRKVSRQEEYRVEC